MSIRSNQASPAGSSSNPYSLPFPLPTQDDVLGYLLAGAKRRAATARKQAAAERRRLAEEKKRSTRVRKVVPPLTIITRLKRSYVLNGRKYTLAELLTLAQVARPKYDLGLVLSKKG
ncbi:hypothetical protein JHW43_008080 [Diplocarpon mali]|nr:hypothetical protein JHW43_008080 [Diplocarpon mali]